MKQKQIQINFIKEVTILWSKFKIIYDKNTNWWSFSFWKCEIIIWTKSYNIDPVYMITVISHEILEVILVSMGARFDNERTRENYLFNFDHQTYENTVQIHTEIMLKFIK